LTISEERLGNLEGDGVVVTVEVGWVLSHEDITEDEVVEAFWEGHGLDTHEALTLNLEDVVSSLEGIVLGVNGEGDVWERVEVGAVTGDGDAGDELVNDGFWTDQEGSSGVDDSLVLGGIDLLGALGNRGEIESPVFLLNNLVGLDDIVAIGIHTWHGHVGILRGVIQVESEGFVGEVAQVDEGVEMVHRDGVVCETENTGHLGGNERNARDGCDLTEAHGGGDVGAHGGNVLRDGTLDGAGSVGDVEGLTVRLICAGLGVVVEGVVPAWDGPALLGVQPEVGGSSIWHDGEGLGWGTNVNLNEVLSVHEVLDGDVLWGSEELILKSLNLSLKLLEGKVLLDHWDLAGLGHTEKSSDSSVFHFF